MSEILMIPLILSKFPKSFRLKLEEAKMNRDWSLNLMEKTMDILITAREKSGIESTELVLFKHIQERGTPQNKQIPNGIKCAFCNGQHFSDDCRKYVSIKDRSQLLRGRCAKCLKLHSSLNCYSNKNCYHCKSTEHHRSLCPKKFQPRQNKVLLVQNDNDENIQEGKTRNLEHDESEIQLYSTETYDKVSSGVIPIFRATLINPNDTKLVLSANIILDTGSASSYVREHVYNKLGLQSVSNGKVTVSTFGSDLPKSMKSITTWIGIKKQDGVIFKLMVRTVPMISSNIRVPYLANIVKETSCTERFADGISPHSNASIDLLVGSDYFWDIFVSKFKEQGGSINLINTIFGVIPSGIIQINTQEESDVLFCNNSIQGKVNKTTNEEDIEQLKKDLSKLWKLDSIGIADDPLSDERIIATSYFIKTLKFKNNRYYIKWPLNSNVATLPHNYYNCLTQLKYLVKRLLNTDGLYEIYERILNDQLRNDILEIIDEKEPSLTGCHYLPHHMVNPLNKPLNKSRIVFNASFKSNKNSKSLNDCLLEGPMLLNDLTGILLRMRLKRTIIVCDIEKAFLQIGIQEKDRDLTRFLWIKNIKNGITNNNITIYRFKRVSFGIKSSPFILCSTLKYHLENSNSKLAKDILSNVYMDNFVVGLDTKEEVMNARAEMKNLLIKCSMNLLEWKSNYNKFNESMPKQERLNSTKINVLGTSWDTESDSLEFKEVTGILIMTKREDTKCLAKVFDPIGFLCPALLKGKIFLKNLWMKSKQWDEDIGVEAKSQIDIILSDIVQIKKVAIPQHIDVCDAEELQLIAFSDASINAYACCVYLQYSKASSWSSKLIFAKSRITPLKNLSIPRLELMGAVIASRSLCFVKNQLSLKIGKTILFTDSKCVAYWYKSTKNLSIFVKNRINELKNNADLIIKYVPTDENPADIPTRGMLVSELAKRHLWWDGPSWLSKDEISWKKYDVDDDNIPKEAFLELNKKDESLHINP